MPDFSLEDKTGGVVCGLDEAGRGPLAGPVVASCVYIPWGKRPLDFVSEINDSKKLSLKKREKLYGLIREHFICGIAESPPEEIDSINILRASLRAMERAFAMASLMSPLPRGEREEARLVRRSPQGEAGSASGEGHEESSDSEFSMPLTLTLSPRGRGDSIVALIDGNHCPQLPCPAIPVIKGDGKSVSIAAASILAKVTRDRIMQRLSQEHPPYGWERNAGYPTAEHLAAIDRHGITPHHRTSYEPVRNFLAFGTTQRHRRLAV